MMNTPGTIKVDTDDFDEELELALIELQQRRLLEQDGHKYSEAIWSPMPHGMAIGIHRDDGGADDKRRTKAELKAEQLQLLEEFRRDWLERTPPTDRFSISTTPDDDRKELESDESGEG
jgi:hypothetical protein